MFLEKTDNLIVAFGAVGANAVATVLFAALRKGVISPAIHKWIEGAKTEETVHLFNTPMTWVIFTGLVGKKSMTVLHRIGFPWAQAILKAHTIAMARLCIAV